MSPYLSIVALRLISFKRQTDKVLPNYLYIYFLQDTYIFFLFIYNLLKYCRFVAFNHENTVISIVTATDNLYFPIVGFYSFCRFVAFL